MNAVWDSGKLDPMTRLPLAVIDTHKFGGHLPSPGAVPVLASRLPAGEFALLVLAGGAPRTPNVAWLARVHAVLPHELKKRLRRAYIVHAPWWARALGSLLKLSPKFAAKTIYVRTVSDLATHIDVTVLRLGYEVWMHDLSLDPMGPRVPKDCVPVFGTPLRAHSVVTDIWDNMLKYLESLNRYPINTLDRTSGTPEEDKVLVLRYAYERQQEIDLTEFGPQVVLASLKLLLLELPYPLVAVDQLPLPIRDTREWVEGALGLVDSIKASFLSQLATVLHKLALQFGSHNVASTMAPVICHTPRPGDAQRVAQRFLRTLIEFWPVRRPGSKPLQATSLNVSAPPPLPRRKIPGARVAKLVDRYEPPPPVPRYDRLQQPVLQQSADKVRPLVPRYRPTASDVESE